MAYPTRKVNCSPGVLSDKDGKRSMTAAGFAQVFPQLFGSSAVVEMLVVPPLPSTTPQPKTRQPQASTSSLLGSTANRTEDSPRDCQPTTSPVPPCWTPLLAEDTFVQTTEASPNPRLQPFRCRGMKKQRKTQEAAAALAMENYHQISTSTPAKRKKVQNANVLTSPVKVVKVENNDDGWNQTVPQQPSCSVQLGTSCSVSPMTLAKEDSLLEDMPEGNSGLHDSDSNILCLDSFEDDSTDEESMDSSLLGDLSNILDEETSKDHLGLPISSQNTLDTRQGSLVFFDVKILKNGSIQMTVVDGEKIFPVLIQPMKYLSSLMAKNSVYEIGLMNLLCHLRTVHRPILGGFGLWSLPFPTLLNALMVMNKKEEFSSVVYGFLDILPLIKEEIPKRDNYKLKNLASTYLWWNFGDCSAMENANMVKYLCEVLDVDLVKKPRLILSQANLESFISLQPLLAEKLLTKPSAQTLAAHNIGLSELWSCYQHNPEKGLQKACHLINTCRHSSEKKVRNLSKVKVYFQRQEKSAESQKTPAGSDFPGAIKNEEEC
nr:PREDICTED: protein PML-like [Haliaeetus albicilla]